jgi:hypothetical protein
VSRRPSNAPGRSRPDVPGFQPILFVQLALFALLLAACDQPALTGQPRTGEASPSTAAGATDPGASSSAQTSSAGEPSPSAAPSTAATPSEPAGQPTDGSTAACSGSDENRDFYASMAGAVDWTVYCPVLPDGWFVNDGHYRLAGGGWMEISYDGPGDATVVLRQGAFCSSGDDCVPGGQAIGDTPFADRTGVLIRADDSGWAIVAERGATISWLLVVHGLDEAGARAVAADLRVVG